MKTIWKYGIPMSVIFSLKLPQEAKILTVQEQHGNPQLWVLVNSDNRNRLEIRKFRIIRTGQSISEGEELEYIGTFQSVSGSFIGHLFEIIKEEKEK